MNDALIEAAGWTMLHFLWQGALIGSVFGIVLVLFRKRPQVRYLAGCFALLTMLGAVATTFSFRYSDVSKKEPMEEMVFREAFVVTHAHLVFTQCLPCHIMPGVDGNSVATFDPGTGCPPGTTGLVSSENIGVEDPSATLAAEDSGAEKLESSSSYFSWLVGGWIFGVTLLSLRFFVSWGVAQRLRSRMNVKAPLPLRQGLKRVASQVGVDRSVSLLISAAVTVPSVIGWLRPVILLPVASVAGLSRAQLEAVLAHELAHIRRHDYLVNLLQHVVEIVLFFHPVVWWVSKKVREDREFCCDDIAAQAAGNTIDYARALATLEEQRAGQLALEVAANGGSLQARIRRLCGVEKPRPLSAAAFPAMLLVLTAVIPFALVRSEEPKVEKAADAEFEARKLTSEDAVAGFRHLLEKPPEPNIKFRDFVMMARALDQESIHTLLNEVGMRGRGLYAAWICSAIYAEMASRDLEAALAHYRESYGRYFGIAVDIPHAIYVGSRPEDPWEALAYLGSIPDDPRFRLTQKESGINGPMVYTNADWFGESHKRLFKKLAAIDPERAWKEMPGNLEASDEPLNHNQLASTYYQYRGMVEGFFSGLKDYKTFQKYFKRFGLVRGPYTDGMAILIAKAWMNHDVSAAHAWAPPQRVPTAEVGSIMAGGVDMHATVGWARENPKAALEVIRKGIIPKWRLSLAGGLLQTDPSLVGELITALETIERSSGAVLNSEVPPSIFYLLHGAMTSNGELQEWDAYPEEGRENRPLDYRARYDFFKAAIANEIFSEEEQTKLRAHLEKSFEKVLNLPKPQPDKK